LVLSLLLRLRQTHCSLVHRLNNVNAGLSLTHFEVGSPE